MLSGRRYFHPMSRNWSTLTLNTDTWNSLMVFLDYPFGPHFGPFILSGVLLVAVYHALNGIRLTIVENGLMLPKPYRPEFHLNRPSALVSIW